MINRHKDLDAVIKIFLKNRNSDEENLNFRDIDELNELIEFIGLAESMHLELLMAEPNEDQIDSFNEAYTLSIDNLSSFFTMGKTANLLKESKDSKGLSVKISEFQKQILEAIASNLSISRTKLLQELVSTYLDSAYYTYLIGKHHKSQNYIDINALIRELREDAIILKSPFHVIRALFRMRDLDPMFNEEFNKEFNSIKSMENEND
ncbi:MULTISPECIES: hypothetical protein [Acinetobacter]|jgi:hypothetical protein|uniref:hypothetical protein n=1 Tax=Acinetobacter TaxID=469 RepID=UPI000B3CD812|nr:MULTISPECIES: hypothetical protein [Acinetobacter]QIC74707.1 hypothetical protein FSC05_13930 [Acinetobacter indicus]